MAASFNLNRPDVFPEGTSVAAYPRSNWPDASAQPSGAPVGSATETKTVTGGVAAFVALTAGVSYWAVAQVASVYRYISITADSTVHTVAEIDIDTDVTLGANSDARVASQKATKGYADSLVAGGSPDASTTVKGITKLATAPASASNPIAVGDNDTRVPSAGQAAALPGTSGTPGSGNKYVTDADARNTNARTPSAHATSHQPGGGDAMAVDAAAATGSLRTLGTGAAQAMQGSLAAPLASPALTGTPTAPTPSASDNSTKLATTAYVDNGDGLLIPKSLVDAKGDILAATADNTVARVAVGANNTVLIADSAQTPGVKWGTVPEAGLTSPSNASKRQIYSANGKFGATIPAATYLIAQNSMVQAATSVDVNPSLFRWVAADHAVTGLTTSLLLRVQLLANATAPGTITFTFGLYPIASIAGAANGLAYTLGTVVTGSTVAFVNPSASTEAVGSATIAVADVTDNTTYAVCVVASATTAANSRTSVHAQLYRYNT